MWNKNDSKKILITVDDQDLYWVRKSDFGCLTFETGSHLKDKLTNEYIILLAFYIEDIPDEPDGFVKGAFYYVEKTDLDNHPPYMQKPDWEKTPWIAPGDAVNWEKEKKKYDLVT
jgi:hypothetical protein